MQSAVQGPFLETRRLVRRRQSRGKDARAGEEGVFTLFVKRWLPKPPKGLDPLSVYLSTPWRVENGTGRATMIGSEKQISGMLRALQESGIRYRVISLTDPKFSSSSLLGLLTDRQREVLDVALSSGYYDIPRRANSDELARRLGVRNATFVAHRRKAERRLMTEILKAQ